jgi:hypothetical protein
LRNDESARHKQYCQRTQQVLHEVSAPLLFFDWFAVPARFTSTVTATSPEQGLPEAVCEVAQANRSRTLEVEMAA